MLSIYFGDMPEAVYNTSVFFDNQYLDDWITDDFSKAVIKAIDKGEVISPNAVDTKALGVIPVTKIAGGTKTLILVNNRPDKVFNASTCGDNCAKWLLKIGKKKDVTVNLRHLMDFGKSDFEIKVLNNGDIVHNMKELVLSAAQYV